MKTIDQGGYQQKMTDIYNLLCQTDGKIKQGVLWYKTLSEGIKEHLVTKTSGEFVTKFIYIKVRDKRPIHYSRPKIIKSRVSRVACDSLSQDDRQWRG